jgi:hypothetical protein
MDADGPSPGTSRYPVQYFIIGLVVSSLVRFQKKKKFKKSNE